MNEGSDRFSESNASPSWARDLDGLLQDFETLRPKPASGEARSDAELRLDAALLCWRSPDWSVLMAGLCSVGKSSFVCALWGDSELLPTAVRDCTQTNTLVRRPAEGESDRRIRLAYLTREAALDFACRDLSFYRLRQLLEEALGPMGPKLEPQDASPEVRLRSATAAVRKLFQDRPDIAVLQEPLTDELEKLEEFLAFLETPDFRPGSEVEARWEERREWLMGRRRLDGRAEGLGRLLAQRHVELTRQGRDWPGGAPILIDSPWIPTFYNARRADLILARAREIDLLVLLSLPEKFEPEPWVLQVWKERPELARRTLVVFNQVDTVDTAVLFGRGGFAQAFEENAERLKRLGVDPENLLIGCARLPFLDQGPQSAEARTRAQRLRGVLGRIRSLAEGRPESGFKRKLLAACDPEDAGIETLRRRLIRLRETELLLLRGRAVLTSLQECLPGPAGQPAIQTLRDRAAQLMKCSLI